VVVVGDEEKGSGRWPRFSGPQGIGHNGWRAGDRSPVFAYSRAMALALCYVKIWS